MSHNTSTPSAEGAEPPSAFDIIAGMETDVRTVADLANGIVLMMCGFDQAALDNEDMVGAVLRVAYDLRSHATSTVADWEKAFTASSAAEKGARA